MNYLLKFFDITDVKQLIPVAYFSSMLITLPWLFLTQPISIILAVGVLAMLYHLFIIFTTGHMVISHNKSITPVVDNVLTVLFFFSTFITPQVWAGYHIQHHKYHDTDKDPQSSKHRGAFRVLFPTWPLALVDRRTYVKKHRIPINKFLHDYFWYLVVVFCMLVLLLPQEFILFWVIPSSVSFLMGTYSAYFTHCDGYPKDSWNILNQIAMFGEGTDHNKHHKEWDHNGKITSFLYD